ncbi:sulfotransferase [Rhodobacterales bacterium HKCCE3408]|nr:sulfotransferase [Rhodobacterales bacterium HKCCE3408]
MFPELDTLRRYPELDGRTFLICVGAMKCATSWLHAYLGARDGVVVSPLKELHFFNPKFPANELSDMNVLALKRLQFHLEQEGEPVGNLERRPAYQASVDRVQMIYDDNAYFAHFARLCDPDTRTFCDITPAYSVIGPTGFDYLRRFCASQDIRTKILFVMRDPLDRLWSQLRYMEQTSPDADILKNWSRALAAPRIVARADYEGTVSDIDATFPAEDVLYLFYETLFSEGSLRRLCTFAECDYAPGDKAQRENATSVTHAMPEDARAAAMTLLAGQYAFCRKRFGAAVPASWQG